MKFLKNFSTVLLLILFLVFLPLDWFHSLGNDPEQFALVNVNGLYVLLQEHGRLGIVFLICIILQVYSCFYQTYLWSACMQIVFGILLTIFPLTIYPLKYISVKILFSFYERGYYLGMLCVFINIFMNINKKIKKRKDDILCGKKSYL